MVDVRDQELFSQAGDVTNRVVLVTGRFICPTHTHQRRTELAASGMVANY